MSDSTIEFLESIGVEAALQHSVRLNRHLLERIDAERYELVSPHPDRSPIVTLRAKELGDLPRRLQDARILVSGSRDRIRVSPAVYNVEDDVERLAEVLEEA